MIMKLLRHFALAAVFFACFPQAARAQTFSQDKSAIGLSTAAASGAFGSNVTAGHLLWAIVSLQSTTATISGFTINGTTVTQPMASPATSGVQRAYWGWVLSATGGSNTGCAATVSPSIDWAISCIEINLGAGCTTTHDQSVTANAGAGTSMAVASTTPAGANEIGIAGGGTNSNRGFSAGAGFSMDLTNGEASGGQSGGVEYVLSQTAATTAPFTITGGSNAWIEAFSLFTAPSCPSAPALKSMMGAGQ